ncbi:MAG: hypothetical protein AAF512_07745 [Pseudomonadota bacterium]
MAQRSQVEDIMVGSEHCMAGYLDIREPYSTAGHGEILSEEIICLAETMGLKDKRYFKYMSGRMLETPLSMQLKNCQPPSFNNASQQIDLDRPLSLKIRYFNGFSQLHLTFGPYSDDEGKYFVLWSNSSGVTQLFQHKSREQLFLPAFQSPLEIILIYQDNAGWQTMSQSLQLDLSKANEQNIVNLSWRRTFDR